jgi:acyl-coenzyme A synthetase/AMP-(fatty) acid ligase
VGIYMQMIPELPIAMLACARLGAPHTVIFSGYGGKAVAERITDMGCKVLITQDGKIMRRLLENVAEGDPLGDTTTLIDASVVESMQQQIKPAPRV